jgi:hypothetical protein
MQQKGGVKLCGHPSYSDFPLCYLTWCPCSQFILFYFIFFAWYDICVSWDFRDVCVCWGALLNCCWDSMLRWIWTLPLCLYFTHLILLLLLLWQVGPCSLIFWLNFRLMELDPVAWFNAAFCHCGLPHWYKRRCSSCSLHRVSMGSPVCSTHTFTHSNRTL